MQAKKIPQAMVHSTGSKLPVGHAPQPYDIVLTKVNASWVYSPHEDVVVITVEIFNSLVHRLLMDNESTVNILYWGAYQKIGSRKADLTQ